MAHHDLKIHEQPFNDLLSGAKTCEVRNNDRGFQVGDTVQLHEIADTFTGRVMVRKITHVQTGYGLPDGLCVLSYAQLPSQGGEAVEVVASIAVDAEGVVQDFTLEPGLDRHPGGYTVTPLMSVRQHQRILAASVGSAEPVAWREHSVNYAKGEKCPETIETLQAAWDRDQELINDMRHEIARHKTRINRLEQRRPAGQVAEAVAWLTSDKRHLVFSGALDQSQYVEQGMTPLYTHPADQVADDLTMVKVPRELANIAALHLENSGYTETGKKLRALLNGGRS